MKLSDALLQNKVMNLIIDVEEHYWKCYRTGIVMPFFFLHITLFSEINSFQK